MRWLAVTIALLAASAALVVGIYVRDRSPGTWRPPERVVVAHDARVLLEDLGGTGCRSACAIVRLIHIGPARWLARMYIARRVRCIEIDSNQFAATERHGLIGIVRVSCSGT